jgi:hypothetical protein
MPKRLGNTQIPSAAGLSDIINLKQHKQYVEQDIFPSPENDVLSGLRFDGSSYLTRTPTAAGNRKTWTWSGWVKLGLLGQTNGMCLFSGANGSSRTRFYHNQNYYLYLDVYNGTSYPLDVRSENLLRDLSSFYHIVVVVDTSTNPTRIEYYVNGVEVVYQSSKSLPAPDTLLYLNDTTEHVIGAIGDYTRKFHGYMANVHFIDGQALDPSHFGYYNRSSRQWKPKKYSGTYGGNGFYLPMLEKSNITNYLAAFAFSTSSSTVFNTMGSTNGSIGSSVSIVKDDLFRNIPVLDGTQNSYVDTGNITNYNELSISFWIKTTATLGTIFSKNSGFASSPSDFPIRAYITNQSIGIDLSTGNDYLQDQTIQGTGTINDGNWHYIVFVINKGTSFKIYIDNVLDTDTTCVNFSTNSRSYVFGRQSVLYGDPVTNPGNYPGYYYQGKFADIRMFNKQLSADEVNTLYYNSIANQGYTFGYDLGTDNNHWNVNGFVSHDSVPDSPQNTFATLNALNPNASFLTDGNLGHSGSTDVKIHATLGFSSSIFYFEVVRGSGSGDGEFGVCRLEAGIPTGNWGEDNNAATIWLQTGVVRWQNLTNNVYGAFSDGDVLIVAMDVDAGKLWMGRNGVWFNSGNPAAGTNPIISSMPSGTWTGCIKQYRSGAFNFGQDPTFGGAESPSTTYTDANGIGAFYYQPPDGALALCTANLSRSVIEDPADYFKAVTYSGDETVGVSKDLGFRPDMIWAKARNIDYNHILIDSLRPHSDADSYYRLHTDAVNSQADYNDNIYITNNGFNCYPRQSGVNENNKTFVAWCWKAGGTPSGGFTGTEAMVDGSQTTCSALASSAGASITPTAMSVNTDAGFSIVKYGGSNTTGLLSSSVSSATIPHGLNDCEFCIIKNIRWSNTWVVSHRSIAPNVMSLQDTGQANSTPPVDPTYGQITTLGSNTVTITRGSTRGDNVGEDFDAGGGQFEYIMYCWHSVEGYSKFGSYTGNGSPDGPFVYTGFRPAFVMLKNVDQSSDWVIYDSARRSFNPMGFRLYANEAYQESGLTSFLDFVSNGVKIVDGSSFNITGNNYIYMAFAEQPFNFTNSR